MTETLRQIVEASRREHYHCDDSWYCCGKCTHPDHGADDWLDDGTETVKPGRPEYPSSHDGEAARQSGVCNCGADAWNARVEAALAAC